MALHPQVQEFCDEINAIEVPPLAERPLAEVREAFNDLVMGLQAPGIDVGRVEDRDIPGPNGPIRIRLYWPKGADPASPLPVYVNYHGSGYVVLSIDTHDGVCRALCEGQAASSSASTTARRRRTSSRNPRRTPGHRSAGLRRTARRSAAIRRASPSAAIPPAAALPP